MFLGLEIILAGLIFYGIGRIICNTDKSNDAVLYLGYNPNEIIDISDQDDNEIPPKYEESTNQPPNYENN